VGDALDSLPEEFLKAMTNVVIAVEEEAEGRDLFGLYLGVPLTKRLREVVREPRQDLHLSKDDLRTLSDEGSGQGPGAHNSDTRDRPPLRSPTPPA